MTTTRADQKQTDDAPQNAEPSGIEQSLAAPDLIRGGPADVAQLIRAQPSSRDAILRQLHPTRGNAFVQQVVVALQAPTPAHGPSSPGGDLHFGSPEHQTYGNEGAHSAGYDETYQPGNRTAVPFALTHGDIVMLSGDYFDPREKDEAGHHVADNLFALAATASPRPGQVIGTRDEVMYAVLHANKSDPRFAKEGAWANVQFSDDVKDSVNNRYLRLAASNFEHFANPNGPGSGGPASGNRHSAGGSYRALHEDAIHRAHDAKKNGQPINEAMAHEAAAEHFLTDGFAAGHLRTPRASIATYWNGKYPLFFENLKKTIAQDVAIYINANETNRVTVFGSVLDIMNGILPSIDDATASMPDVGFDAIVATLTHDVDNAEGLWVKNDLGQRWRTFGDSHGGVVAPILAKQAETKTHVEEAVKLGVGDVMNAYDVDTKASDQETLSQVRSKTPAPAIAGQPKYGAEQVMPVVDPARAADNGTQGWQQPDFQSLWATPVRSDEPAQTFGNLIKASMDKGDFGDQLASLASKFPIAQPTHGTELHPHVAYMNGFLAAMKADPRSKIQQVIDYDPGRGQANSRTDDATREDIERLEAGGRRDQAAGKPGADYHSRLRGLTFTERIHYIHNLESFEGWTTSRNEAWRIYDLFDTAKPDERKALYKALEGHDWNGSFQRRSDDLWDNLEHEQLESLTRMLNESP